MSGKRLCARKLSILAAAGVGYAAGVRDRLPEILKMIEVAVHVSKNHYKSAVEEALRMADTDCSQERPALPSMHAPAYSLCLKETAKEADDRQQQLFDAHAPSLPYVIDDPSACDQCVAMFAAYHELQLIAATLPGMSRVHV